MKEKGKVALIILALIGFATVAVLLIMKIDDIGKMGASVSTTAYSCDSGWKLNQSTKKCTKTVSAKNQCAKGYKYTSKYDICYKSATRNASNYICSTKLDILKNISGLGYVCTRKSTKSCNSYKTSTISVKQNNNSCILTTDAVINNGWKNGCYYKNGKTVVGQSKIGNNWYYISVKNGSNKSCKAYKLSWGCDKSKGAWRYDYGPYSMKNGSYNIEGKTYKFDSNGYCTGTNCHNDKCASGSTKRIYNGSYTGWKNNCYYSNGEAFNGLNKIKNTWYYITMDNSSNNSCKAYKLSWSCDKSKGAWRYNYGPYRMQNGKFNINGTTYKFDSNGYCVGSNCQNNKCK